MKKFTTYLAEIATTQTSIAFMIGLFGLILELTHIPFVINTISKNFQEEGFFGLIYAIVGSLIFPAMVIVVGNTILKDWKVYKAEENGNK